MTSNKEGIEAWSKLYGKSIIEEEYLEICHNLKEFFGILQEWNQAELPLTPTEK